MKFSLPKIFKRDYNSDKPIVNLSGANSLFGSIGGKKIPVPVNVDFAPLDDQGNVIDFTDNNGNPAWLGLEFKSMQWWAYNYCSPLAAVIDRIASATANGIIEFQNEDGTTVKNPAKNPKLNRIQKLFRKPNPWQTGQEFDAQQTVLCKIFGYSLVWTICPFGVDKSYTKMMVNLNPYYCTPIFNYQWKVNETEKLDYPIKEWIVNIPGVGTTFTVPAEDIMIVKDGFVDATNNLYHLPVSKVAGLDYAISNICAGMEADNVLLKKKGMLGFISYDAKPEFGSLNPMNPNDADNLQRDLARYGLTVSQLQYAISKMPAKWVPMAFDVDKLKIKETIRQGIDMICDRMDYPAELMSGKNATYENRSSAERFLYQNNIIPYSIRWGARWDNWFELEDIHIVKDYDHLPVLQEDILHAGQAFKAEAEGIDILWKAGMLTMNQCLKRLDQDEVPGMDIYYPEWVEKYGKNLIDNGKPKDKPTSKDKKVSGDA